MGTIGCEKITSNDVVYCKYPSGYTDKRVAEEIGFECTESNVKYVRQSVYGPIYIEPKPDAPKTLIQRVTDLELENDTIRMEVRDLTERFKYLEGMFRQSYSPGHIRVDGAGGSPDLKLTTSNIGSGDGSISGAGRNN